MAKDTKSKAAAGDDGLAFEQILEQLEAVVESLEEGERPLEEALTTFERGVSLARAGTRKLDEAERRIELLLRDEDGVQTRPLKEQTEDE